MTSLTFREHSVVAYDRIVSLAQEASVTSNADPEAFIHAFTRIIPEAQESRMQANASAAAGLSAMAYQDSGGRATYTRNTFKVKPNLSDFVIDVQNAARRTLTTQEYGYFKQTYFVDFLGIANMEDPLDKTPDGRDKFLAAHLEKYHPRDRDMVAAMDRRIREKLGAAFIDRGIYPFDDYMNKAGHDVRKRFEK